MAGKATYATGVQLCRKTTPLAQKPGTHMTILEMWANEVRMAKCALHHILMRIVLVERKGGNRNTWVLVTFST